MTTFDVLTKITLTPPLSYLNTEERTFRNTVQRNLETKQNRQTLETPEQTINNNNYVDDENPALTHTEQKQQQRYKNFQKKFLNRK